MNDPEILTRSLGNEEIPCTHHKHLIAKMVAVVVLRANFSSAIRSLHFNQPEKPIYIAVYKCKYF